MLSIRQVKQTVARAGGNPDYLVNFTAIQHKALALVRSRAKHILLYGGSRSGKTHLFVIVIILRALQYPGSCHLICRYRAKHARSSVLHQTLIPILNKLILRKGYTYLKQDSLITLYNGSEIWVGGLGDPDQLDKVLGHEYNTIFFNEVSEISFAAVTTAWSRLAKVIPECRNQFLYDCNPTTPLHWAHKVFILKKDFLSGENLKDPQRYAALLMNPADNQVNLSKDYITGVLDSLPEKQKARFRDGAWVVPDGAIYEKFDESMIVKQENLPKDFDRFSAGHDFGIDMANVKVGWKGDSVYVLADHGSFNGTVKSFNEELTDLGWFNEDFPVYCDPSGGERVQEITNGVRASNSVDSGIDCLCAKIERGEFFVAENCRGVLSEIWDYRRDEYGRIVKSADHYMDALRYAVYSETQRGIILS